MDGRLLEWLQTCGVAIAQGEDADSPSEELLEGLKSGAVVVSLLRKVGKLKQGETAEAALTEIESGQGERDRDSDWTLLLQQLTKLEVAVTPEMQAGAKAGDLQAITDILRVLQDTSTPAQEPKGVYLDTLDVGKPLDQSDSCIEFLLLSFCSSFHLSPKQAAGLLARNNQFLSRILLKGLKGDFEPVVTWYQNLYQCTPRLSELLQRDQTSIDSVLTALKPGMGSKASEVVQWSLRTYTKLALDLEERGLADKAWEWFTLKGLEAVVGAVRKWGVEMRSNGMETLLHFAHPHLLEFFSLHLRDLLADSGVYFGFLLDLLPLMKETQWATEALLSCRVLQYWVEAAGREAAGSKVKLTALLFLTYIWQEFISTTDDSEAALDTLLTSLKRAFHESSLLVKSTALGLLLELLDFLTQTKSATAPVLYKTLTLLMMELEPHELIREQLVYSFRRVLIESPSIPLGVLLEPLCKRVQAAEGGYSLSIADFDLFTAAAGHARLSVQHAIQLIDVLGKVYLSDMIYSRAAMASFCVIATRFIDSEPMLEYLSAFLKFGLVQVQATEKSLKDKRYIKAQSYEYRAEVGLLRRKRDVVLEMTQWLLQLGHEELNSRIKEICTATALEMRQSNQGDSKGLLIVLREFGDPQTVLSSYQKAKDLEDNALALVSADDPSIPKERKPFPWKRAFADIENAKKRAQEREQRIKDEQNSQLKRLTAKQTQLALQLDIRRVEQGLAKDTQTAVYAEGIVAKLVSAEEEAALREFTLEEKDDLDAVKLITKKFSRVFKVLFQKYAGTGFARKKEAAMAFDWLAERKNRLFDSEYIRMFLDLRVLPRLISKEEVRSILKAYCHKISHQAELNWVDYSGFVGCFCQFAYYIFGREPQDLSYLPPVVSVKALIDTMRSATKASGHSVEVYDEPDPGSGDKDVVKQLTKLLAEDPQTPLPHGYKRVQDQDLTVSFSVPQLLDLPPAVSAALEIVDKVLFEGLQIHFLEPKIQYFTVYRAKGVAPKKEKVVLPPIHERPASLLKRKIRAHVDEKPKEVPRSSVHLSPVLKFQLAHCSEEEQARVRECAGLLEDMLHSLSLHMNRVIVREAARHRPNRTVSPEVLRGDKDKKPVIDPAMKVKRANKQREVLAQLQKAIADKQRLKEDKEAAEQREKAKAQQRAQVLAAKKRKEREEHDQLAKEQKVQKLEETRRQQEVEQRVRAAALSKQRKVAREFKKKAEERLSEALVKKQREGLAKRPATISSPDIREEIAESQRRFERQAREDRKRLEEQDKRKEEFNKFVESREVQGLLERYGKALELVFSFYCKQSLTRLHQQPESLFNELKFTDLARFLSQFGIVPALIPSEVALLTFNSLTRLKSRSAGLPATLAYPDFLVALLRLTEEAKGKLNEIGKAQETGRGKEKQDALTAKTLQALFTWMELNLSQRELGEKLKQLQGARPSRRSGLSSSVDSLRPQDLSTNVGRTVNASPARISQPELPRLPKRSP